MNMGIMAPIMTLVLHLIFGAVLGWVYGLLVAWRDVSNSQARA
jgi:ribose/xylose/arabinose/galactoside ABC-type transport system permease subunit